MNKGKDMTRNVQLIAGYYAANIAAVRAYITARTGDVEAGKDLAQTLFMRLLSTDRVICAVTLPSLVYTMASRLAADYGRHRATRRELERSAASAAAEACDVHTLYSASETAALLESGMAHLPAESRMVYRMNVLGGMKVGEIAKVTAIKYKTVENRLGHARKAIRLYMARAIGM